jgi:N-acetylglucosamine-6-sulfatase
MGSIEHGRGMVAAANVGGSGPTSVVTTALAVLATVLAATAHVDARGIGGTALAGPPPNIVVLMLDDVPGDMDIRLLERLPRVSGTFITKGQRWDRFYANDPLCCPGRASFLTGLYSHHHGVTSNRATLFRPKESVATQLRSHGYHTVITGKYLNGVEHLTDKTPPGWAKVAITSNGYFTDWWVQGTNVHRSTEYHTDVLAGYAVKYLRSAPATKPVFLMLNAYATHGAGGNPAFPRPATRHLKDPRCADVGVRMTPAYYEADVSDKPAFVQALSATPPFPNGWPLVVACRTLLSVDEMFGRVLAELKLQGRLQNTLFLLTADNPNQWGDHRIEGKNVPWGLRLPLYVRWPARLGATPTVISVPGQMTDLAPTIVEAAGIADPLGPYPTGQAGPDGASLLPAILGRDHVARTELLDEHRLGWFGVTTTRGHELGAWHYIEWAGGGRELYDLAADPWELESRIADRAYADIATALSARLAELRQ